jgi:F-type H+-transporting ATPase subunit epsilon
VIRLQLVTLTGKIFDDDVYEVVLPTLDGQIGVLQDHMPLVSAAKHGVISVRRKSTDRDDQMEHFATNGGVIEVSNNVLKVLVDQADNAEDISEADAKAAHDRALKLKSEAKDEVSLEQAQQLVDRAAVRLEVAGLKRRKNRS